MLVDKKNELMSNLLFTVHQHGGDDVTWKPPIAYEIKPFRARVQEGEKVETGAEGFAPLLSNFPARAKWNVEPNLVPIFSSFSSSNYYNNSNIILSFSTDNGDGSKNVIFQFAENVTEIVNVFSWSWFLVEHSQV